MRRSTLLFVPLLAAAALVAVVALTGAREDTPTVFERVATNPERFAGEHVRVSGRIVARPENSALLVMENAAGQRLLLEPPQDERPPFGVRIAVRGRVELLVNRVAAQVGTSALVRMREFAARPG